MSGSMPAVRHAAIVGTGFAASAHLDALRRLPRVKVAGILGSRPERSAEAAARLGIDRVFGSLDELVADPSVDVVHDCTPNHERARVTAAVLGAGKHSVSEKPLGLDSDQAAALAGQARSAGVVAAVCFNYRHFPLVQEMRSLIASGTDGPIHLVHGAYLQDWLLRDDDWNWRLESAKAGGARATGDIGSHWIDLVQHVTGDRIVAVCAQLGRVYEERWRPTGEVRTFERGGGDRERVAVDTEDMATILLRFASGAQGSCTLSQVSAGRKNHLVVEIDAAEASFAWDQEEPNRLWIGRRDGANREVLRDPTLLSPDVAPLAHLPAGHQEGWADGLRNLMLDVYAAVDAHGGGEVHHSIFATFDEAAGVARVVEAILQSDRSSAWVDVARDTNQPIETVPRIPKA